MKLRALANDADRASSGSGGIDSLAHGRKEVVDEKDVGEIVDLGNAYESAPRYLHPERIV